jgi:hypothetical protein
MTSPDSADLLFEVNSSWNAFDERFLKKFPDNDLYHYTSASSALNGILKSRKIWLSPFNDMNDPSEIVHGIELALPIASQIMRMKKLASDIKTYEKFIELIQRDQATNLLEFYFFCFSEAGDEDISQWREYGGRGQGYCVRFRKDVAFFNPARMFDAAFAKTPLLGVRPIIYDDALKLQLLQDFFNMFDPLLLKFGPSGSLWVNFFLRQLCTYFKHRAYSPEKEWRTIVLAKDNKLLLGFGSLDVFELSGQFRKKAVVDLPCRKENLDGIESITCGPRQNHSKFSATKKFVDDLQVANAHKVTALLSKVPMI